MQCHVKEINNLFFLAKEINNLLDYKLENSHLILPSVINKHSTQNKGRGKSMERTCLMGDQKNGRGKSIGRDEKL